MDVPHLSLYPCNLINRTIHQSNQDRPIIQYGSNAPYHRRISATGGGLSNVLLDIIRLDFALKVRSVGTVADSLKDHHSRPPVTDTGSCEAAFVVKVGGRRRCTASSNSWLRALTERLIDEQVGWQCRSGWEDG